VCKCVLGSSSSKASQPLNILAHAFSSTLAFSVRLMPSRLTVVCSTFPGFCAPALPSLIATQRVHPPHLPPSLSGLLYIHQHDDLTTTNLPNLTTTKRKETDSHASYLIKIWSLGHGPRATTSHIHVPWKTRRLHTYMSIGSPGSSPALVVASAPPLLRVPPFCAK
jgi:hypothetical protein